MREVQLTVAPGVASLLADAHRSDAVTHVLTGDLAQMAAQERHLVRNGITMGRSGGIPGMFSEEDFKAGLSILWRDKVEGWWNYRREFVFRGICTNCSFHAEENRMRKR